MGILTILQQTPSLKFVKGDKLFMPEMDVNLKWGFMKTA
jgi:hypothetical protein